MKNTKKLLINKKLIASLNQNSMHNLHGGAFNVIVKSGMEFCTLSPKPIPNSINVVCPRPGSAFQCYSVPETKCKPTL